MNPTFKKGHQFTAPCGKMGYTLTRDVFVAEPITSDLFHPIGGAPKPQGNMPQWLAKQLSKNHA